MNGDRAERRSGRSLRARLLLSAAVFIAAAILAVGLVINGLLEHFVRGEVAGRLDLQIADVAADILSPRPDRDSPRRPPAPEPGRGPDGPPSGHERGGWYWQASRGARIIAASRSLVGRPLALPEDEDRRAGRGPPDRLIEMVGPAGERLVARLRDIPGPEGPLRILATAPRDIVTTPLRNAALTIAATLALLGLGLGAAIALQVRYALSPLDSLRRSLGEVREGRRERIDATQPRELQPLADELNALLAHDAEILRQARLHVANLAHGLKTPLATLSAQAARQPDATARSEWQALTELMDRRIRHHLRRARSAARGGPARHRTELRPHTEDLTDMMTRFGDGPARRIALNLDLDPNLAVAVDAEDLDEMLGNLLENAWRHARSQVAVAARQEGRDIRITIADDGAGLTRDEIGRVLQPGARLDEATPGHGFGLPITAEIAELYGGSLDLGPAAIGGLEASLRLPAPISAARDGGMVRQLVSPPVPDPLSSA